MEKTAILYAPAKGSTERVARLLHEKIGTQKSDLILVEESTEATIIEPYKKLIFGISTVGRETWDSKYKKIGWDFFISKIEKVSFEGKTVAIFGLGDHILYSDNFVDSMGSLARQLVNSGASLVGQTPTEGYTFSDSDALEDDIFVGLPIDEDNQSEFTEKRLDGWLKIISKQMGL